MLLNNLKWLLLDCVIFGLSGFIFGFIVDTFIDEPIGNEFILKTFFLIVIQLFISICVIYIIDKVYEFIFKRSSDETFGITIFVVTFFLPQIQLLKRSEILYNFFTGKKY